MEPSPASPSEARSGIPRGRGTLPHHLDTRTRRRGALPVHGTLRSAASKERAAAGEPGLRRGAPVLLLSPSKMAVNRRRALNKARSRANIATRMRAAAAEAACAAAMAGSAAADEQESLRPAAGPVMRTASGFANGDGPATAASTLAAGGRDADAWSSETEEGEIIDEGRAGRPWYFSVATVNARTASEAELCVAFRNGLRRHGPGIFLVDELMGEAACLQVAKVTRSVKAGKANAIFNTQSVDVMEELQQSEPDSVDRLRRQSLLAGPGLINLVDILKKLCGILFAVFGVQYEASQPKALLTLGGAKRQMPHGDVAEPAGNPPLMVGVIFAVEDGSFLDSWPGNFCDDVWPGEEVVTVRTSEVLRLHIPVRAAAVFRGDTVHRGVENPNPRKILRRIHLYLTQRDVTLKEGWQNATHPVAEIP